MKKRDASSAQNSLPVTDPRMIFVFLSFSSLGFGILGWVMASTYPGVVVPLSALLAIVFGLLGVRSRFRSIGLIGFVMGMFLLPNAIMTLMHLFGV